MSKKSLVSGLQVWKDLGAVTEELDVQGLKEAKLIAANRIHPNPNQPRRTSDPDALVELAESIRTQGLLQPLVVCLQGEDFLIIAGHRRYEACKMIGMERIPCIVREADEGQILEQALIENIQRENINPVEEAQCYRALMKEHSYSIRDLASRIHKSVGYIHGRLELLVHEDIAQSVLEGQIGVFDARELAKVENENERHALILGVVSGEVDREQLKEMVERSKPKPQQLPLFDPEVFSRRWQKLRRELEALDAKALATEQQDQAKQLLEEMKQTIERALAQMESSVLDTSRQHEVFNS
ncbi:MAG: ParB/RepB/Spo0J family partition protein [Anaerolineae bacterium]